MRGGRALVLVVALGLGILSAWTGLRASADGSAAAGDAAGGRWRPWALRATADGRRLFVACGGRGTVAAVDVASRRVAREFSVGGTPRGVALSPDGSILAVSLDPEDEVVLLDAATGALGHRVDLADGDGGPVAPEGLAFSRDGGVLYVAAKAGGNVLVVDVARRKVVDRMPAGREPFALAVSPDGRTLAVVSRRATIANPDEVPTSELDLIALPDPTVPIRAGTHRVSRRVALPSVHLSEDLAFTPDGSRVLVPGLRVRNLLPIVQVARGWVVSSVLAVVRVASGETSVLPLTQPERGFADPGGIAVLPDLARAFVVSGGGDEVGVLDLGALLAAEADGLPGRPENHELALRWLTKRTPTGKNPRGIAPVGRGAGALIAVSECLDDRVLLLDSEGDVVGRIDLGARPPADGLLRGERTFHDASYCFQEAFSCRSCHPEGQTDGLTYDFEIDGVGEHVVLNRSLHGLEGTAPFKWTGTNPTLQRQCGARFAMVLTRARVFPAARLDDLAAWLLSMPPPRPLLDVEKAPEVLRASILRGRRIFRRSRASDGRRLRPAERCITCHPPPQYTNRQVTDVGTRGSRDPDGFFDVPQLTGIGRKAPYLHDGRALRLEDIWKTEGAGEGHGLVSDLTPAEFRDLVRYLGSL